MRVEPPYNWINHYLHLGWPIFPLYSVEFGHCACWHGSQCKNPGKHPRNGNGFHGATTDCNLIDDWFWKWPDANVGVPTGGPVGLVIDVDPRHDGHHSLADLEDHYGRLPRTYTVSTGGGGWHRYFSMDGIDPPIRNSAGLLGPGIDIRGEGGYVVVPPSEILMGAYTVEISADLAPIPEWMVELLRLPRRTQAQSRQRQGLASHLTAGMGVGEAPHNLDEAVIQMMGAVEGCRNHTLNATAYWAGRRIAGGSLDLSDVVERLTIAAELSGLDDDEIERTLWSGLTAGIEVE
jgi:hypothetical protein